MAAGVVGEQPPDNSLLDFILGWTAIDILNDDLERRRKKEEKSNQRIEDD